MAEDIPFDRSMPAKPHVVTQVSPLLRRLIANNGGPFTFTGTCTYLVGAGREVVVVDPGPVDRLHRDAILAAVGSARLTAILVTHTHKDHAPGAADLKALTGAPVLGCARPWRTEGGADAAVLDATHDMTYAPDRVLAEGDVVAGPDFRLTAVATPGHTANHLAFALEEENALLSGDHVMAWSTTVVAPPDGAMRAYMASLDKLQARSDSTYWPGHGGPVRNPQRFVRALAGHRRQREQAILQRLRDGDRTIPTIVRAIYTGLAPALRGGASLTVLAHLEDLVERGLVRTSGAPAIAAEFHPMAAAAEPEPTPLPP